MKARASLIFGLFITIVIVGVLVWVVRSGPTQTEIASAVQVLPPLPTNQLSDQDFQGLTTRQMHGTLPVTPLPPTPSRNDPFS